jgi:hypothetical protein
MIELSQANWPKPGVNPEFCHAPQNGKIIRLPNFAVFSTGNPQNDG